MMKIKSKNGKVYEYGYKQVFLKESEHEYLKELAREKDKTIIGALRDIIKYYKNNN